MEEKNKLDERMKVEVKDGKVYMYQYKLDLQDNNKKTVGKRDIIDVYDIKDAKVLKQSIEQDLKSLRDKKAAHEQMLNENKNKFDNKEIPELKRFIALSQKAQAYNQMAQLRDARDNAVAAIQKCERDLEKFKDLPTE